MRFSVPFVPAIDDGSGTNPVTGSAFSHERGIEDGDPRGKTPDITGDQSKSPFVSGHNT